MSSTDFKELYSTDLQRSFKGDASEVAFLLGGIGTGNISIGARGELRDFEIFNRPAKGFKFPYTFFALWLKEKGKPPLCRVLESKLSPPFSKSHGFNSGEVAGLPRFARSTLRGEYPFVRVDLEDDDLPVKVSLEAYTPFIPLNPEDSGIPCGILKYKVKNNSDSDIEFSIAASLTNLVGFVEFDLFKNFKIDKRALNSNRFLVQEEFSGIYLCSEGLEENELGFGNMAIITTEKNVTCKPVWFDGAWFDGIQDFWDDFMNDGKLDTVSVEGGEGNSMLKQKLVTGSLAANHTLKPNEEKEISFIITWYFPNRVKSWNEDCADSSCCDSIKNIIKNNYALRFTSAWNIAEYVIKNQQRLENETRNFHKALFSSTLPNFILDAVSSNITVLRSTTCFWFENGIFAGYEGCFDNNGCCPGTCTHVWNYAQTLAFLFPTLEKTMREIEFNIETDEDGKMAFRTLQIMDNDKWNFHPAADGQMGTVIRLYREWKITGDNDFLKKVWDKAKKVLNFAFSHWDRDGDFVLDSQQHNTYDIEFYGPNSLTNSMFFAALKAGSQMAEALGEHETAVKYTKAFEDGSSRMDKLLWNGQYYIQNIEDIDQYKYQYGKGCLSDQLLGQFLAHIAGLGYVLPKEHVAKAMQSVFKYNFKEDFVSHCNVQRTYVLNDEKGLVLCSWPDGGRPRFPFVYSDEVWTGIEYQVAANLIYEGLIEEGLTIVKAVRDRHDGYRRNPWNEVECGHHYARAMSSWALLTALSGFKCDMVKKEISFSPVIFRDNFSTFFSMGRGWGIFSQRYTKETNLYEYNVEVLYGDLTGIKVLVDGIVVVTI